MSITCFLFAFLLGADDPPKKVDPTIGSKQKKAIKAKERDQLESQARELIQKNPKSEAAIMAKAILEGKPMGAGVGWFALPAGKKYDWDWLAKANGIPTDGAIQVSRLPKSSPLAMLDRDESGDITQDDFDWSEKSPWIRQQQASEAIFRKLDADGSGRLSENEWKSAFAKAKRDGTLTQDSFRAMLFAQKEKRKRDSGGPPRGMLLKGLFTGEIGCAEEGPVLGETAPDFVLDTSKGQSFRLSQFRGRQPVVIVFGSFT